VDVLAHGLWAGALFGRRSEQYWRWAFVLGAAPDLIALGPFTAWQMLGSGTADFPPSVYGAYNLTHSLVVWAAAAVALWLFKTEFSWIWCAWGLHILCDILLHETSFFPTPYLWPFKTHFINGVFWGQLWLIAANYAALVLTYHCFANEVILSKCR
jgi:hypothetical protein